MHRHLRWLQVLHRLHVELVQGLDRERGRSVDVLLVLIVFFVGVLAEALGPDAEVAAPVIIHVQVVAEVGVVCLLFLLQNVSSSEAVA